MIEILKNAIKRGQKALSEYDSTKLLAQAGISVPEIRLSVSLDQALEYAEEIKYPLVLKGCSDTLLHKSDLGMVKVGLKTPDELKAAYNDIVSKGILLDGVIIQELIRGDEREFVIGLIRDRQFGPCVMFGLGGIFTEILRDMVFRVAPLTETDAGEMLDEIGTAGILKEFRGNPPVNMTELINILICVGELGIRYNEIAEVDINPLKIKNGLPVAVDALVILNNSRYRMNSEIVSK